MPTKPVAPVRMSFIVMKEGNLALCESGISRAVKRSR